MRDYEYLQGLIDHENGNNGGALEHLEKAIALLPGEYGYWDGHADFFYSLAEVWADLEDWERAREWYEKVPNLTKGRLYYLGTYVMTYFKLGNVFEALGKNAEAIVNYEKFLDLWKDADPGLPEVEDARKRLTKTK